MGKYDKAWEKIHFNDYTQQKAPFKALYGKITEWCNKIPVLQGAVRLFQADPDVTYRGFEKKIQEWEIAQLAEEDSQSIDDSSLDLADHDASVLSSPGKMPERRVGDKIPWLRALLDDEPNLLEQWKAKRTRIADLKDKLYNLRKELVQLEDAMDAVKNSDDLDDYL